MASPQEDDNQQFFILGLAGGVILLVLLLVFGVALHQSRGAHGQAPATAQSAAAPARVESVAVAAIPEGAGVVVEAGVVKFYFATGSAELAPGAAEALTTILGGLKNGRQAVVSGFHDTTGDAAQNEELAKRRAMTVQKVLVDLGASEEKVVLQKPEATTGSGSNAQARRVEVRLAD